MRKIIFAQGEYYHLFCRGNNKQTIFRDNRDKIRFLFLILNFQSPMTHNNLGRYVNNYVKDSTFNIKDEDIDTMIEDRYVELVSFALMPNHFHLIVKEVEDKGVSQYMHRVLTSYTKYFNAKHEHTGHLFQGSYGAVHVSDNEQLLYLSAYIHRNPRDIKKWFNKEREYYWSSYQDYINKNRWGKLLENSIIIDQFKDGKDYDGEVQQSGAKELLDEKHTII